MVLQYLRRRQWHPTPVLLPGESVGAVLGILTTEDEMVGWHHQLNGHEFE